jgi:hypothetical protein
LFDRREERRMQELFTPNFLNEHRNLLVQDDEQQACDAAFLGCLPNDNCVQCFSALQTEGIDWASVTKETPCVDVVKFLTDGNHCTSLLSDKPARDIFCRTFNACVVWDDDVWSNDDAFPADGEMSINCTALTECNWKGMHPSFIGDGVCHNNIGGCYNTEICKWDGGDCCEDTCDGVYTYVECGHDGFRCKNPDR